MTCAAWVRHPNHAGRPVRFGLRMRRFFVYCQFVCMNSHGPCTGRPLRTRFCPASATRERARQSRPGAPWPGAPRFTKSSYGAPRYGAAPFRPRCSRWDRRRDDPGSASMRSACRHRRHSLPDALIIPGSHFSVTVPVRYILRLVFGSGTHGRLRGIGARGASRHYGAPAGGWGWGKDTVAGSGISGILRQGGQPYKVGPARLAALAECDHPEHVDRPRIEAVYHVRRVRGICVCHKHRECVLRLGRP